MSTTSGAAGPGAPREPTGVDYGSPTVPPASWVNVTNNFAGMASECGNMSGVYANPTEDQLIADIARNGLWTLNSAETTWTVTGTQGDALYHRTSMITWDPDHPKTFYESGIYGWENPWSNGAFISQDDGVTLKGFNSLSTIQSAQDSIAVDFNDPDRKMMLAGGHEQTDVLFQSTDGGVTWANIRALLPAGLGFCTTTLVIDANTLLVGCNASYSQKSGGIVRSTDAGAHWSQPGSAGVSGQPLWASDGQIYWSAEGGGMWKSTDLGAHWGQVGTNSQTGGVRPMELPDGRIASSTGSQLVISADHGTSWQSIGPQITSTPASGPPVTITPSGAAYSPFRRAFYAWHFTCDNPVPNDGVLRFGWDFKTQ